MVNSENQIDILINYKSNFASALKDAEDKVATLSKSITDSHTRFSEISRSRTKAANDERRFIKENLTSLQQELKVSESILKSKKEATNYVSKGVLTQRNALDTMFKDTENYNKRASDIIKNRLIKESSQEDAKITSMLKAQEALNTSIIADNTRRFNSETLGNKQVVDNIVATRKQQQSQTMNQWKQETDAKVAGRKKELADMKQYMLEKDRLEKASQAKQSKQDANTFSGSFTSGSSFGHKVGTTTQYAIAGTALFGVASALTSLGAAAVEADLNMRTMAAVLNLSVPMAKNLDESVRKLGEAYGGTTDEIEKVALSLGRAGVATRDIVKATEITLAMARLTGDTFEQSASAVISYQQVFGNTTSIEVLGDKLAYVANASRLSTQDIGTFSNYALAAAKDVGLTEDAVGGLAAAFSNAGVNASTIGTQIRRFTSLLSDNSTTVTDFYRGIGVNQSNLLASLKQGGAVSNKALLDFVKTLKAVDDAKFTNLTGNMDILAANSLQLMRNNSANISKFVNDLQNNATGQLDKTKVILDSYLVTFQGLWNKLSNFSIKAANNQIDILNDMLSRADIATAMFTNGLDGMDVAGKKAVAFQMSKDINLLAKNEQEYNDKQVDFIKYMERKVELTKQIEERKQKLLSTTAKEQTQEEKLAKATDNQVAVLNALKTAKKDTKEYKTLQGILVEVNAEIKKLDSGSKKVDIAPILNSPATDLQAQANFIKSLVDGQKDTSFALSNFNREYDKTLAKNKEATTGQIESLKNLPNMRDAILALNDTDTTTSISQLTALQDSLIASNKEITEINKAAGTTVKGGILENNAGLNVITAILGIKKETLEVETLSNNLATKQKSKAESLQKAEEAKRKAQETAERRAEAEAARIQRVTDRRNDATTKYLEYTTQLNNLEDAGITKAESKFKIQSELLGKAYEAGQLAKGTSQEEEKSVDYLESLAKYQEINLGFVTKTKEEEIARANLMADYKDSLDSSIASQEYRLGLVKDERLNEVEKLKLKVQQDLLSGKINEADAEALNRQIELLERLSKKKKDIYTFTTEYQRQIDDQETVGYNAMKAGITSLESGMMNFFDVTSEGWLDWHALASDVLSSVYKQLLEQLVIKQLVSGITMGISGAMGNISAASTYGTNIGSQQTSMLAAQDAGFKLAKGGMVPTKGYANGGVLSGGTGIRDDIYLGNVSGTQVFAMGGEFITRKSSVNDETKGTLDYINKTGSTPNQGSQVNVPVKINIENNTGQGISADMIESITKPNDKGEYEKVVNIVLKASMTDPRIRSILKGR